MCTTPNIFTQPVSSDAATEAAARAINAPAHLASMADQAKPPAAGSRRRRLWELPSNALCPVIGVCLPMPVLRRRIGTGSTAAQSLSDYDLHCYAINECSAGRSAIGIVLQRELDQRYAIAQRQINPHKTTVALAHAWDAALAGGGNINIAGVFWATLTHARCDAVLQEQVLRDIHMLQHQVGAANRADLQRLETVCDENIVLGRELGRVQARSSRLLAERATQLDSLQAERLRLRGELMGRDTLIAGLREDLALLEAGSEQLRGLRNRQQQAEHIRLQQARIHDLERALLSAGQTAVHEQARQRRRADEARQALLHPPEPVPVSGPTSLPNFGEQSVLCVGGRTGAVPIYRQLIERTGGRFLHHDGGEEHAAAQLDASLAAADLVICQTGCISHDAYWRVKDHCKRTGKRCVFVDKPSASSLQRALGSLGAVSMAASADGASD